MMKKVIFMAALAAVMALGSSAKASILFGNPSLKSNTGISEVRDDSVGIFIDKNGTADVLDVGDIIRGIIQFSSVDGTSFSGGKVFAAYSFEVKSTSANRIIVGNVSNDSDSVLQWLSDTGSSVIDNTTDTGGPTSLKDTSVVVLEAASTMDISDVKSNLTKISDSNAAFDNWNVVIKAGVDFNAGGGHEIISTSTLDLRDLSATTGFRAAPAGTKDLARYEAGYKVNAIDHPMGHTLKDVPYLGNPFATLPGSGFVGEISVYDGGINRATSGQITAGWEFADDGTFLMNPVPEPSTIAIWAVAGIGAVGFGVRRRMKNAKKA